MDILKYKKILIFLIQEHRSLFIYFVSSGSYTFQHTDFFTSLAKFTPKDFITFDVIAKEIIFFFRYFTLSV